MADDPDDARHGVDDFDAIVAGWRRDGDVPRWPDPPGDDTPAVDAPEDGGAGDGPAGADRPSAGAGADGDAAPPAPGPVRSGSTARDPAAPRPRATGGPPAPHRPPTGPADVDDDHFVPPDPPPLPRIGPPAAVGLVLLVLGVVLVSAPDWVGVSSVYGLPLGLLVLAAGLGWLVLRLWPTPPSDDDDDGARL